MPGTPDRQTVWIDTVRESARGDRCRLGHEMAYGREGYARFTVRMTSHKWVPCMKALSLLACALHVSGWGFNVAAWSNIQQSLDRCRYISRRNPSRRYGWGRAFARCTVCFHSVGYRSLANVSIHTGIRDMHHHHQHFYELAYNQALYNFSLSLYIRSAFMCSSRMPGECIFPRHGNDCNGV